MLSVYTGIFSFFFKNTHLRVHKAWVRYVFNSYQLSKTGQDHLVVLKKKEVFEIILRGMRSRFPSFSTWRDRKHLSCRATRSAFPQTGSSAAAFSATQWRTLSDPQWQTQPCGCSLPSYFLLEQVNCVSAFTVVQLSLWIQTERERTILPSLFDCLF